MTIYRKQGTWIQSNFRARIGGSGFVNRVVRRRSGGTWIVTSQLGLTGSANPGNTVVGPGSHAVAASPGLSITGAGSGSYSFSTVFLSGDPGIALTGASTLGVGAQITLSGTTVRSASFRTTITDTSTGQTFSFDWTVTLAHDV